MMTPPEKPASFSAERDERLHEVVESALPWVLHAACRREALARWERLGGDMLDRTVHERETHLRRMTEELLAKVSAAERTQVAQAMFVQMKLRQRTRAVRTFPPWQPDHDGLRGEFERHSKNVFQFNRRSPEAAACPPDGIELRYDTFGSECPSCRGRFEIRVYLDGHKTFPARCAACRVELTGAAELFLLRTDLMQDLGSGGKKAGTPDFARTSSTHE